MRSANVNVKRDNICIYTAKICLFADQNLIHNKVGGRKELTEVIRLTQIIENDYSQYLSKRPLR